MDDLDVRRALEILSRQGGLNIMIAPGVTGRVTANLERATLNQALRAILKLSDLIARREDGMIYVYSRLEFKQLAVANQPIASRLYRLNYIRASDLMTMITELLSDVGTMTSTPESEEGISTGPVTSRGVGGGGGGGGGAVAPSSGGGGGGGGGGSTGGNSMAGGDVLIVRDYEENLKAVDAIVELMDIQPVQVLVEAVIISVELRRQNELGVNYSVVDNLAQALGTIGNGAELVANSGFTPAKLLTVPADATAAAIAAAGRINGGTATGGLSSSTNGIKFGFVSANNSGFIRALETLGETRVLASPRLLVLNKQKAEIQLGQRLGYSTVTQNFTSTVQQIQFLNTGTLLRLRPFVSSDGMVRMEIHPERSSGVVNAISGLPNSNTAEVTTNVMIPDGATLVIGGLIENEDSYTQEGLPGLNRLPILGAAFGQKSRAKNKRELIVLLTPHIWKQGLGRLPVEPMEAAAAPGESRNGPAGTSVAARRGKDLSRPSGRRPPATDDEPQTSPDPDRSPPAYSPAMATEPVAGRTAPEPRAGNGPTRHVVGRGENFWTISRRCYGSGRYYLALWDVNRDLVDAPERLSVGDTIQIPPLETLDRSLEVDPRTRCVADGSSAEEAVTARRLSRPQTPIDAQVMQADFAESSPGRVDARPTASGEGRVRRDPYPTHRVGPRETVRSIARDRLGDPRRATEIIELNRGVIPPSGRPSPGQRLELPKDALPPAAAR
ncbi:LysM peptidoglycan-binding domain-containing protein [Paludisphaera mucosa]|uniref:Secretin N-terminal domain-containing protein n=1 Tax=Paludisphaera mucosa TaxID=3030827 RepID=A0ABT6FJE6_9BACT|nr:LysM peptidoglycan-binding domain-containing protein [Paludisphaera mucosa]MDG3007713.1 secretin N-terminal domain-containing protein [Paludisphaera mucosa]